MNGRHFRWSGPFKTKLAENYSKKVFEIKYHSITDLNGILYMRRPLDVDKILHVTPKDGEKSCRSAIYQTSKSRLYQFKNKMCVHTFHHLTYNKLAQITVQTENKSLERMYILNLADLWFN